MKRFTIRLVLFTAIIAALDLGCSGGNGSSKSKSDAGTDSDEQESSVEPCGSDSDCSDGKFCNGVERCNPGAKGSDERGCAVASKGPCQDGESCEESTKKCIACSENADVDGDNHDAVDCGGDDCDDNDANRYPGNVEVCDNKNHDEDCDPTTFGDKDSDGDGHIDAKCCNTGAADGKKHCGDDCDDETVARHPKQLEVCDEIDNDCDGKTDEEKNVVNWYEDKDGDGFGSKTVVKKACQLVQGASLLNTDRDDSDESIHPGAAEKCDKIDNNCDGQTDEADECGSCGASDDVKACLCTGRVLGFRICQPNGSWSDCDCTKPPSATSGKAGAGGGGGAGGAGSGKGGTGGAGGSTGSSGGDGQSFSLFVTETPPGPTIAKNIWGGVLRFTLAGDGAPLVDAGGIDSNQVADPTGLSFLATSSELLVGNRHGNTAADGVTGSISRFVYDRAMGTLIPNGTITGNELNSVTQIAFNPITDEMFAANYKGGPAISRFIFDSGGNAIPNGTLGSGSTQGIAISPDGKTLYATSGSTVIKQYDLTTGNVSTGATISAARRLFLLSVRNNELYVPAIDVNTVYRLSIGSSGNLTVKDSFAADGPVAVTFSPDGQEMFTAGHLTSHVINRFQYDAQNDSWKATAKFTTSSSLGQILVIPQ